MGRKLLIVASKRYGDYVKEIAEVKNFTTAEGGCCCLERY